MKYYKEILEDPQFAADKASFYSRIYTLQAKRQKKLFQKDRGDFKSICMEEYDDLSKRLERSRFQDSSNARNVLNARRLANLLISDEGKVNLSQIPKLIKCLTEHLYFLGPDRQDDAPKQEHILKALRLMAENKQLVSVIQTISRPYSHKIIEQIIRDTLQLPGNFTITDAHARKACLAAWFCYLRQNVGSCFATAPAIVVHDEQPEQFFKDLGELLSSGRLKRTFGGNEYAVPISASWGAGDLRRNVAVFADNEEELASLALSPGLLNALESIKLIPEELSLTQRIQKAQQLVFKVLHAYAQRGYLLYINAEQILREILLGHLGITEMDLENFEKSPRGMMHSSLIMQPHLGATRSKSEACFTFYSQLEIAKSAFKNLTENALLKTWEFTLASFAETKPNFTTWNLYSSLGFKPEEGGGIGNALYEMISHKLEQSNQKVHEYQEEYELLYSQLKYIEARVRNASSEKELNWIKIEYESKRNEFRTFEEMRNREHYKAGRFANLLNDLVDTYLELFPKYFQEVYDADMHEVKTGFYDDSPAGFRLLYKHGRTNTSQWTLIYTPQDYIEALTSFFTATEVEILAMPHFEGLQEDVSEIITRVITQIKTDEFLVSAFQRMGAMHQSALVKNPLENWKQIEKKPWSYTSGGSIDNLLSCYFRLDGKPTQVSRWVENEMELLVFFIDTFKQMPAKVLDDYIAHPSKSLLSHSPTHAYNLKPGFIKEAVASDAFTYTWTRDNMLRPMERFLEYMFLSEQMQEELINKLALLLPHRFRPRFKYIFSILEGKKNPREFCLWIKEKMESDGGLSLGGETVLQSATIASHLFSWLPLFSSYELKNRLEKILHQLTGIVESDFFQLDAIIEEVISTIKGEAILTAQQLQDIAKAVLILFFDSTSFPCDYHLEVAKAAQELGYALVKPVIFADTNWSKELFGFAVSPASGKFELWRVDYTGTRGAPMSSWQDWLDGSRKDRTWGVYNKPSEYVSS
ncbi:Uncharacterized protein PHSC3_000789 [Chlamydiales bacterium STE3]|nr:Uncharacterized protein PHSC3_000789 [Chlamydiales bacterium STE3]